MNEESMALLGAAFWLTEHGYTTEQAARFAQPVLESLQQGLREADQ